MRRTILAVLLAAGLAGSAQAADLRDEGPKSLVITYKVAPSARLAFRDAVRAATLPRLKALKASGELTAYHVLLSRYADGQSWDMLVALDFRNPGDLAHWRQIEASAPAGLSPEALALVTEVDSAPGDVMRTEGQPEAGEAPVYLAVPYDYLVSTSDYLSYVDGYLVPQTEGWIEAGALASYGVFLPRYAAGRTWSSLLLLAYRGDAGLGRRDSVVKAVRAHLAATSPAWKAFAEGKEKIRVEKVPMIADELN